MKRIALTTGLFIVLSHGNSACNTLNELHASYVDFDKGMGKGQSFYARELRKKTRSKQNSRLWDFLKKHYKENNFLTIEKLSEMPKIPKIIHQIWLGSPFPEKYKKWQQSWITHHPDWKYKLWTDENIHTIKLYNQDLYDDLTCWGKKSDIARLEILEKFGGIYVDTDFECLKPFDLLVHSYDFFIGLVPLNCVSILGNGIIASLPGHPILKHCIENLHKTRHKKSSVARTGAGPLGASFMLLANKIEGKNIALPTNYVHPLRKYYWKAGHPGKIEPESFAVHHWEGSWAPQAS